MQRILLVDDDALLLRALKRTLTAAWPEAAIVTALDGDAACAALAAAPVDVLITDLDMPGMHGAALLAHARASAPAMLRVAHTGREVALADLPDAQLLVHKPCSPATLVAQIQAELPAPCRAAC